MNQFKEKFWKILGLVSQQIVQVPECKYQHQD